MINIKKTIITGFCLIILGMTIFPLNGLAFIIPPPPGGRAPPTDPPTLNNPPTPDYDGRISLAWSEVARATGYELFRSDPSEEYQIIKTTSQLSYTDQVPTSGLWFYKVRAYNIHGNGPFSDRASVQVISEDILAWWCDDVNAEIVWGGYEDATDVDTNRPHGGGIKVCIIDTGCDYTHVDLGDNYIYGYDFEGDGVTPDDNPMDESNSGHGTHVAGIVAMKDSEIGYIGIAPHVSFYMLRIKEEDIPSSQVIAALNWAIDNDMDIISMSFGAWYDEWYVPWEDWEITSISDRLHVANQTGIVLVAAAGNYLNYPGHPTDVMFPACYPAVISVGAVNSEFYRANVSNTGTWGSCYGDRDPELFGDELDLVAPGVDIISTTYGNTWSELNGTSFACPIVAGVCALMLSKNPNLTPDQIRTILRNTAEKVGGVTYEDGWHQEYGYGMVDAEAAVNAV